ncbi:hypothetical protein OPV22_000021 [Ensete ventricosum]|uniref:Legume lectin domain-containing protein n=1 Tax=Ensete ventricosum TaxID=4639 RepID=A0AAV8RUX0_ENSVE|nr:hypothetical protein OPV22_000021 [Ensete ventricosum]
MRPRPAGALLLAIVVASAIIELSPQRVAAARLVPDGTGGSYVAFKSTGGKGGATVAVWMEGLSHGPSPKDRRGQSGRASSDQMEFFLLPTPDLFADVNMLS